MTSALTLLYLAVLFAPIVTPFVALGAAAALVRRARARVPGSGWPPGGGTCALVLLLAGSVAFGAYAWGVMSGPLLDPGQWCSAQGVAGDRVVTRMSLPVSVRCVTSDGHGTEMVGSWINPTVCTGLAVAALAVGAWAAALRYRLTPLSPDAAALARATARTPHAGGAVRRRAVGGSRFPR